MEKESHYDVLGVPKTASEAELKKAYRVLSLKYHPDRNSTSDAADKIRQINEAYEILSDSSKRRQYDAEQSGRGFLSGFHPGMGMPFSHMQSFDEMDDIHDIFKMFFGGVHGGVPGGGGFPGVVPGGGFPGGGGGFPGIRIFHSGGPPGGPIFHQHIQKPPPITKSVEITIEQAYYGCTLPLLIERWSMMGDLRVQEEETIYITIPQGVDDNEMIALKDKGNSINETCKGDVKIGIHVVNETAFKRNGLDLIYKKSILLRDSLCGFSFEFKHLNGKTLNLNNKMNPTIVKPNYKKTVAGLGMIRDGVYGNLVIEFDVEFPDSLSKEQIEAIGNILI
jgi:DnaJ-class molecular chaperone